MTQTVARIACALGAIVVGLSPSYVNNTLERIASVQISERKTSTLPRADREKIFAQYVKPLKGLEGDAARFYESLCVDGVYGSNPRDFNYPVDEVKRVLDKCGWPVQTTSTPTPVPVNYK